MEDEKRAGNTYVLRKETFQRKRAQVGTELTKSLERQFGPDTESQIFKVFTWRNLAFVPKVADENINCIN